MDATRKDRRLNGICPLKDFNSQIRQVSFGNWETKESSKKLQFSPESLRAMLEYWNIELGLLATSCGIIEYSVGKSEQFIMADWGIELECTHVYLLVRVSCSIWSNHQSCLMIAIQFSSKVVKCSLWSRIALKPTVQPMMKFSQLYL